MDPNGDGWVTTTGSVFVSDDQSEFEIPYLAIPQVSAEPSGDLGTGSTCGPTDIVDDPNTGADGSYYFIGDPDGISGSGDELLQFRLRMAKDPGAGAFGFSVLVDTDILFGASDPNSVSGNPGFEFEIRLKSGGGAGIFVDNVDGTTAGTNLASFGIGSNSQRSYALSQDINCTSSVVFFDFYVPLAALNMTDNSNFRLIAATASSPGSVLNGSASDIGGTNDTDPLYTGNQDLLFSTAIVEQGTGLNDNSLGLTGKKITEVKIFPNPANKNVNIQLKENIGINKITVYSLTGQSIYGVPQSKSTNAIIVDVSYLSPGMYFLSIDTEKGNFMTKLQVTKN
jgi:hypothetical protein